MDYKRGLILVGYEVAWRTDYGVERGRVIEVCGTYVRVEYGPWGDTMWLPTARLID